MLQSDEFILRLCLNFFDVFFYFFVFKLAEEMFPEITCSLVTFKMKIFKILKFSHLCYKILELWSHQSLVCTSLMNKPFKIGSKKWYFFGSKFVIFSITLTSKSTSNPFKHSSFILPCIQRAFQLCSLNNVKEMKRHFSFKHLFSIQFIIAIK